MSKALVFGVTGQLGSFMSEYLIEKGDIVVGAARRVSTPNTTNIKPLLLNQAFTLRHCDITDPMNVLRLIREVRPDVIYNFAAQSHVHVSFEEPEHTFRTVLNGTLNILESVRTLFLYNTRVWTASSSEMFGSSIDPDGFQRETTAFIPRSPYAIAKLAGHHLIRNYRESYGLFACSGILFNTESPRRGEQFVTRKISRYVALASKSKNEYVTPLKLGNVGAYRDWGAAKDKIVGIYKMMQHDTPDDFIFGTAETHSVAEFVELAFATGGIPVNVQCDEPSLLRASEVDRLCGDFSKAKRVLGWEPTTSFKELVMDMVMEDIRGIDAKDL